MGREVKRLGPWEVQHLKVSRENQGVARRVREKPGGMAPWEESSRRKSREGSQDKYHRKLREMRTRDCSMDLGTQRSHVTLERESHLGSTMNRGGFEE